MRTQSVTIILRQSNCLLDTDCLLHYAPYFALHNQTGSAFFCLMFQFQCRTNLTKTQETKVTPMAKMLKLVAGAELQPSVLQAVHSTFSHPLATGHSLSMLPLLWAIMHFLVTLTWPVLVSVIDKKDVNFMQGKTGRHL